MNAIRISCRNCNHVGPSTSILMPGVGNTVVCENCGSRSWDRYTETQPTSGTVGPPVTTPTIDARPTQVLLDESAGDAHHAQHPPPPPPIWSVAAESVNKTGFSISGNTLHTAHNIQQHPLPATGHQSPNSAPASGSLPVQQASTKESKSNNGAAIVGGIFGLIMIIIAASRFITSENTNNSTKSTAVSVITAPNDKVVIYRYSGTWALYSRNENGFLATVNFDVTGDRVTITDIHNPSNKVVIQGLRGEPASISQSGTDVIYAGDSVRFQLTKNYSAVFATIIHNVNGIIGEGNFIKSNY